ncbi:SDR family oxidoreductase [Pandoraea sputorum]|uniref:SDR family oxidoreductase n=1 Tax=Pandoraea sputorum TaxID=93222 RepID=UPI0037CB83B9
MRASSAWFASAARWRRNPFLAGDLGAPEDIARAALFLASDDSRYVLDAEIVVDGGVPHFRPCDGGGGQRSGAQREAGHLIHGKLTKIQRTGRRGVHFAVLYYALNDLRYC